MKQQRFQSVWDAIEKSEVGAANMKARAELMIAIRDSAQAWNTTQTACAKRLGLTQPRMSDLVKGRVSKFSLDALMNIAVKAGLSVSVKIRRAA